MGEKEDEEEKEKQTRASSLLAIVSNASRFCPPPHCAPSRSGIMIRGDRFENKIDFAENRSRSSALLRCNVVYAEGMFAQA